MDGSSIACLKFTKPDGCSRHLLRVMRYGTRQESARPLWLHLDHVIEQ